MVLQVSKNLALFDQSVGCDFTVHVFFSHIVMWLIKYVCDNVILNKWYQSNFITTWYKGRKDMIEK